MQAIIEVRDAVKQFRETTALNHVSVQYEAGKIHGIIGRNGSGKTVLLKCICGFMRLTAGDILVRGKPVQPARAQDMGIIIEEPGFIGGMSAQKNLELLASIRGIAGKDRVREVLTMVGLGAAGRKHVSKFSLGMRHRLGIAQAIMERPDICLFDEPMNGLDRQGVREMRDVFRSLRDQGVTILLASHYAEDIGVLCDTVTEMDAGRVVRLPGGPACDRLADENTREPDGKADDGWNSRRN